MVVAIPKHIARDMNIRVGHKVVVDRSPDGESVMIKRSQKTAYPKKGSRASQVEFQKWLSEFMPENGEILDELATR